MVLENTPEDLTIFEKSRLRMLKKQKQYRKKRIHQKPVQETFEKTKQKLLEKQQSIKKVKEKEDRLEFEKSKKRLRRKQRLSQHCASPYFQFDASEVSSLNTENGEELDANVYQGFIAPSSKNRTISDSSQITYSEGGFTAFDEDDVALESKKLEGVKEVEEFSVASHTQSLSYEECVE